MFKTIIYILLVVIAVAGMETLSPGTVVYSTEKAVKGCQTITNWVIEKLQSEDTKTPTIPFGMAKTYKWIYNESSRIYYFKKPDSTTWEYYGTVPPEGVDIGDIKTTR